jgi:hypothetical protein
LKKYPFLVMVAILDGGLKIEKRGDEILIVHCCFSISQNEAQILTAATWQ